VTNLPLLQNVDTNLLTELTDCLKFEMFQPGNFLLISLFFIIISEKTMVNIFLCFVLNKVRFNEKRNTDWVEWGTPRKITTYCNGMKDLTIFK